MNKKSLKMPMR